ncbi:MAG: hypothetical protein ACE5FV_04030 [Woeseia sp.]
MSRHQDLLQELRYRHMFHSAVACTICVWVVPQFTALVVVGGPNPQLVSLRYEPAFIAMKQ